LLFCGLLFTWGKTFHVNWFPWVFRFECFWFLECRRSRTLRMLLFHTLNFAFLVLYTVSEFFSKTFNGMWVVASRKPNEFIKRIELVCQEGFLLLRYSWPAFDSFPSTEGTQSSQRSWWRKQKKGMEAMTERISVSCKGSQQWNLGKKRLTSKGLIRSHDSSLLVIKSLPRSTFSFKTVIRVTLFLCVSNLGGIDCAQSYLGSVLWVLFHKESVHS
jgi:hypothetical protein